MCISDRGNITLLRLNEMVLFMSLMRKKNVFKLLIKAPSYVNSKVIASKV